MSIAANLKTVVEAQWTWFGQDKGKDDKYVNAAGATTTTPVAGRQKERVQPYAERIADYWLAIPASQYKKLVADNAPHLGRLDGTVHKLAWSAAFISYCMQMAGAGNLFPYNSGHVAWINKAIANRKAGKLKASLVGYRPTEEPVRVGDLLANPRQGGVSYDQLPSWFISHSDIIVEVDLPARKAFMIGGNVGQSVSRVEVPLAADGKLRNPGDWMVHIRNNIPAPSGAEVSGENSTIAG